MKKSEIKAIIKEELKTIMKEAITPEDRNKFRRFGDDMDMAIRLLSRARKTLVTLKLPGGVVPGGDKKEETSIKLKNAILTVYQIHDEFEEFLFSDDESANLPKIGEKISKEQWTPEFQKSLIGKQVYVPLETGPEEIRKIIKTLPDITGGVVVDKPVGGITKWNIDALEELP